MNGDLDYSVDTALDVENAVNKLEESMKRLGYGILSRIDVRKILMEKNSQDIEPYMILEVCNPKHAGAAMDKNRKIGIALPCKITVHREGSETQLTLLRPTVSIHNAGVPDMEEMAQSVENELMTCMDDVAKAVVAGD